MVLQVAGLGALTLFGKALLSFRAVFPCQQGRDSAKAT